MGFLKKCFFGDFINFNKGANLSNEYLLENN